MLTKRVNILFQEEVYKYLIILAKKHKTSVSDLVRRAVYKVYFDKRIMNFNNDSGQTRMT